MVDPANNQQMLMFYNGADSNFQFQHGWATASFANAENGIWTPYVSNPVVTGNSYLDSVIYVAGVYHLYETRQAANMSVYHRTSTDRITWSAGTQVLTAAGQGRNDGTDVSACATYFDGSTFHHFYNRRNSGAGLILPDISYATSPDGITLTKQGAGPIVTAAQIGADYCEWHQVLKVGATWVLVIGNYYGDAGQSYGFWKTNIFFSATPGAGWQASKLNPVLSQTLQRRYVSTAAFFQIPTTGVWHCIYQDAPMGYPIGPNNGASNQYGVQRWDLLQAKVLRSDFWAQVLI